MQQVDASAPAVNGPRLIPSNYPWEPVDPKDIAYRRAVAEAILEYEIAVTPIAKAHGWRDYLRESEADWRRLCDRIAAAGGAP